MPQFKAGLLHFLVTDPGQVTSAFWILVFSLSEQDAAYSLSLGCEEQRLSQLSLAMKTPPPHPTHLPLPPERGKMKSHTQLTQGGHAV